MDLIIKKETAQRLGYDLLAPFGVSRESWETWRESQTIDLAKYSNAQIEEMLALFSRFSKARGVGVLIHDIKLWQKVLAEGAQEKRARTVRQFTTLLQQYLLHVPGHRIYRRHDDGAMLCYYVSEVTYHPPVERSDYRQPAYTQMTLVYEEIGGSTRAEVQFDSGACINVPTAEALIQKGYLIETVELRADYLLQTARYTEVSTQVGRQYWGRGLAYTIGGDRFSSKPNTILLDRYGEPTRVVIDVFQEEGERGKSERDYVDVHPYFWPNVPKAAHYDSITDRFEGPEDEDVVLEKPEIEVPIHPWIVVFHLGKHLRLRAHVAQVEEYIYDEHLAEKLILPQEQKDLVKLLIDTKGGTFRDIVQGKGGGAVVLLTGDPGTGKTLTAEVYAESEKRALYSVQCSQLGTTPEKLEDALIQVFDRARRWNAVMLLDEADVYVHERGDSMQQNAIVGVFLRVLEYQGSILFLTSNRPEDVDDAISSRCVARLHYNPPNEEDAMRIWRILADNARISIDDNTIWKTVHRNPGMTGRDIKNILKLAALMRKDSNPVTIAQIEYVKQFKPTGKMLD